MSVYVQSNLAVHLDEIFREQFSDLLSPRPGAWVVTIVDKPEATAWDVSIDGPDGFQWAKRFEGAERRGDFILESARTATELPGLDLTDALAELGREGVAFTTEIGRDGKTVYVIDRIRLREDELVLLKNAGALTREGIRQYLVDRAA